MNTITPKENDEQYIFKITALVENYIGYTEMKGYFPQVQVCKACPVTREASFTGFIRLVKFIRFITFITFVKRAP